MERAETKGEGMMAAVMTWDPKARRQWWLGKRLPQGLETSLVSSARKVASVRTTAEG
jgi:hypothetical protein